MQELNFSYTKKDFSNFNKDTLTTKRVLKFVLKTNVATAVIVSLIVSVCFTTGLFGGIYLTYWMYYICIVCSFVVGYISLNIFALAIQFISGGKMIQKRQQGINEDFKLTINDDLIIVDNGDIHSTFKWASIKDVYNKKNTILIFIADIQAIMIPKRVFNSEKEIDNCWNYIQDCYNKTHPVECKH